MTPIVFERDDQLLRLRLPLYICVLGMVVQLFFSNIYEESELSIHIHIRACDVALYLQLETTHIVIIRESASLPALYYICIYCRFAPARRNLSAQRRTDL